MVPTPAGSVRYFDEGTLYGIVGVSGAEGHMKVLTGLVNALKFVTS